MLDYRRRVVDDELDALLTGSSAIVIQGPRGVGKTTSALQRARTVYALDDPTQRDLVTADPSRLVRGEPPVLIDEWQLIPSSWDLVRRAVDADRIPGRFIITGSAAPRTRPVHSGAGRLVPIRMRPMTLVERGVGRPAVSLAGLLRHGAQGIDAETDVGLDRYAHEILASGFPAIRELSERSRRAELDAYLELILQRDLVSVGPEIRSVSAMRRWLAAFAAAVSTTTSFEKVRVAAMGADREPPARSTTRRYVDALQSTWLLESIPGWQPTGSELSRMTLAPKHQLADPALAGRLRRLTMDRLLAGDGAGVFAGRHATALGALFESLVTLDVLVYAQACEADVSHLRDRGGSHEVDLVVEGLDGRVVAVEVKLSATVSDGDVRHLRWLGERLGDRLAAAVVVTTGRHAYVRRDGVAVVPAALLGP